jgi:Tfp pilus assembly protein PilF
LDYENDKKEITTLAKALDTHQLRTPYFHLVRAKLHQQLNRKERAYKELAAARRLSPNNKDVLWMESGFAKLWQDWEKAEDTLKEVLEIDPYNVYAMFGLAEVYHVQNDWDSFLKIVKALKNSGGFIDKEEQQKLDVMIRDVPET